MTTEERIWRVTYRRPGRDQRRKMFVSKAACQDFLESLRTGDANLPDVEFIDVRVADVQWRESDL